MRITCPHCGPRGLAEYTYYGDATVTRPQIDAPMQAWTEYVYLRENANGRHKELWYHAAGCHAWVVVTRDLGTHEIMSAVQA